MIADRPNNLPCPDEPDRDAVVEPMRRTIARVARGGGVLFALLTLLPWFMGRPIYPWFEVLNGCTALMSYLFGRWLSARPRTLAQLHGGGYVLAFYTSAHGFIAAHLYRDARDIIPVAFAIVGLGAILVYRRPTLIAMALLGLGAVAVSVRVGGPVDYGFVILFMSIAGMIGSSILESRLETIAQGEALRTADRIHREQLATALVQLEAELAERKQGEARRVELESQLQQAQKLDALGTLAGGVAHDINNMLTAIVGVAEQAAEEQPMESVAREDLELILAAARSGASLTTNLLGFARRGKRKDVVFNLNTIVQEVIALLGRTAPKSVRFVSELRGDIVSVVGDPGQITQAVMNLCLNAAQAITHEGTVRLRTLRSTMTDGESDVLPSGALSVILEVIDDGQGMDADTLAHAFEPFYSSKPASTHNSGLGLAMVYGAMRDHHGEVVLRSTPGHGTTATLRFPAADVEVARTPSPVPRSNIGPVGPVLIIDDESLVRSALRRMLRADDTPCVEACSGADGVAIFADRVTDFSLVLLDLAMPEMGGAECFTRLREIDATVPIILMSGYSKDQSVETLLASGNASFVNKPFHREDLRAAVALRRRVTME